LDWAKYPDRVFHEIVGDAIDVAYDFLDEPNRSKKARIPRVERREQLDWFKETMPRSAKLFTPDEMLVVLRRLADGHRDEETLYHCTDYHWLVLYEVLAHFVEITNDLAAYEKKGARIASYSIMTIDFGHIVDAFFHDTDFLGDYVADASDDLKRQMGISPETWGLVTGLKPHPEEIVLKPRTDWGEPPFVPSQGPRATAHLTTYPPDDISPSTEWYYGEGAAPEP
jgi:hypothetical protein